MAVAAALAAAAPARGAEPSCAAVAGPAVAADGTCWSEIDPYPFGSDGGPVDPASARCAPTAAGDVLPCYLTVTSMAFRAPDRGLAATDGGAGNAFGVWRFNGTRWFPDPTFPGQRTCQGDTVLWAGKLDVWLVGPGPALSWPSLCRFDGASFTWVPLPVPAEALAPLTPPGSTRPSPGGITTGACFSWDDCWFSGTSGVRLRWDGVTLRDASPDRAREPWLAGEATAAVTGRRPDGRPFGLIAAATSTRARADGPLPPRPDGRQAPALSGSRGGAVAPLDLVPPGVPLPADPARTDVVALGAGPGGDGWLAGNPAGFRAAFLAADSDAPPAGRTLARTPEPAPLLAIGPDGAPRADCAGPPPSRFTFSREVAPAGTFLWSSVATLPGTGDALAVGRSRAAAAAGATVPGSSEPVLVRAACDGTTTETRFRIPDPDHAGATVPAARFGTATAVAASAPNDAWAAASRGELGTREEPVAQRPRLYRLGDGRPPAAAPGDDDEPRPVDLRDDEPVVVEEEQPPLAVELAPAPTVTTTGRTVNLGPAIDRVRSRLVGRTRPRPRLILTFRVRRTVGVGVKGLRGRRVVARTPVRRFVRGQGRLVLRLDPRRWPKRIRFVIRDGAAR
jgi:hypothetical protein